MGIVISDSSLTTTISVGSTIADKYGYIDEYSTTVSCLTTSLTPNPGNNYIFLNSANNYLNSLSNEQLVMLEEKVNQKEEEIIQVGDKKFTIEQLASKTTLPSPKENPKTLKKI